MQKYQPRPEIIEEIVLRLAKTRSSYDDVIQIIADCFEWTTTQAHIYLEGTLQGPFPLNLCYT